jgi:hypothetical protein
MQKKKLGLFILSLGSVWASCKSVAPDDSATKYLDVSRVGQNPGIEDFEISSLGTTEHCIIMGGYPELGPEMEKEVFRGKKAEALCELGFGEMPAGQNHALCPKDNSTNPGVEIFDIEGLGVSRQAYESGTGSTGCNRTTEGKKLAKFKGTVTCSSTAAIIAGYYMGRLLDIGNVPASVLRTVNTKTMRELTDRGLRTDISESWASWDKILKGTASEEVKDLTLTADKKFVYGALSVNPGGETKYQGYNIKPYSAFVGTKMVSKAMSPRSTSDIMEGATGLKAYALAQEIKGFGDLIIFDTILSQSDRLGNIHSKVTYFGEDPVTHKIDSETKLDKAIARFGAGNFSEAPQLLLKDNDCGLRGNSTVFLENNTTFKLTHISPETYARVRWLMVEYKSGRLAKFLKEVALRQDAGTVKNRWGKTAIASIKEALTRMDADFYGRCISGKLKLDLDPTDLAKRGIPSDAELKRRCNLVWNPKGTSSDPTGWDSSDGSTTVLAGPILTTAAVGGHSGPVAPESPGVTGGGSPNLCTAQSGTPGVCISASECTNLGADHMSQPTRCLRDPDGIFCCFKR